MNMLGVSLQRAYGRSIMLGFHAAYSLGGILGASLAWAGAHWHLSLGAVVRAGGGSAAAAGDGGAVAGTCDQKADLPGTGETRGAPGHAGRGPRGDAGCCCRSAW